MSGDSYKIVNQHGIYFLTLTVVEWVDLFTRKDYSLIVVDALNYCHQQKYSWCIMSSHVHIVCKVNEPNKLSDVLRDFKKHTSKQFIKTMNEIGESRREWLQNKFSFEAHRIGRAENFKIWKDDNHAIEIGGYINIETKINYVHNNPVQAMLVSKAEDYVFSSARDYTDENGLVAITKAF